MHYIAIAAGETDLVLGPGAQGHNAGKGQVLTRLVISVDTVGAGGASSIKDGSGSAIPLTNASTPIDTFTVELDATSQTGPWSVTTGANVTIIAVGEFG